MPDRQAPDRRPHLVLTDSSTAQAFTAQGGGGSHSEVPAQNRAQHGNALKTQLAALKPMARQAAESQSDHGLVSGLGIQIEFVGIPDVELAFESLGNERAKDPLKRIEVLSIRTEDSRTFANVFVPEGKLEHFERYIADYLAERRNALGHDLGHRGLLDAISSIRRAEIRALWTDDLALLPVNTADEFWWEVWLPVRGNRAQVVGDFQKLAALADCRFSDRQIDFPERTVVLMFGSEQKFSRSVLLLNCVAELRRAKETAEFFMSLNSNEQAEWAVDARARLTVAPANDATPRVCMLDSGLNRGHALLEQLVEPDDLHTVEPTWGIEDNVNHGTGIAGLISFGDLTDSLTSTGAIRCDHRLESVKIIPDESTNDGDSVQHGYLFAEAVARPEVSAPFRRRVFTSAVTANDDRDLGRPSSWSATVDRLASDYDTNGQSPRLFILCTGNTVDAQSWEAYPQSLSTRGILDPGQAWNALTVGAFTEKTVITEDDADELRPVAEGGALSPFTRTSATWSSAWPLKPEVVFEGGNAARDDAGAVGITSLQLLTTHHRPVERMFSTSNATSAASALAARMAAQLMSAYPELRPETVRALITHAAEWTPAMLRTYLPTHRQSNKSDYVNLIRHCGWGVPNIERALWSAGNSLTLIAEDELHPFQKRIGESPSSRDMNLHSIPWPKAQLLALPSETSVELRVTLSYFIEPNPSARGSASKFHYPSHRLRFDVQRPLDLTTDDFVARLNAASAREDDGDAVDSRDPDWLLGDRQRHRGSLHQDIWTGTAAELANRGFIAVYPSKGWWRTRPGLQRYDLLAHYSLVVSIRTPGVETDLYTAVAQEIAAASAIPIVAN